MTDLPSGEIQSDDIIDDNTYNTQHALAIQRWSAPPRPLSREERRALHLRDYFSSPKSGCAYPDPSDDDRFCDAPRRKGSSYCDCHHALCHTPAPPDSEPDTARLVRLDADPGKPLYI